MITLKTSLTTLALFTAMLLATALALGQNPDGGPGRTNVPLPVVEPLQYKHAYSQLLTYKIYLATKPDKVVLTFAQALDIIRQVHQDTRGLKQIVYLVGWQYDGHDSKYPAWFEVNQRLKRPEDADGRSSLLWLMREAKAYNAVVSLHINMCDAYMNSPLWDEYVQKDLLCRNKDGSLFKAGIWDGEQSYRVSKTREWQAGYAKKRIDALLAMLPIADAGTIHIDTFFPKPSPYHGVTYRDEVLTCQEILQYWHAKGVDVTGELFIHEFAGLLPMAYHLNLDEESRLKYPPSLICGGGSAWNQRSRKVAADNLAWAGVLTAPEGGCRFEEAWGYSVDNDINSLDGVKRFLSTVYLRTTPWLFLNQHTAQGYSSTKDMYEVDFADGVVSRVRKQDRYLTIQQDGRLLVDGTDLCVPMIWQQQAYLAYSRLGGEKHWSLPPEWKGTTQVTISPLNQMPDMQPHTLQVTDNQMDITLAAGQAVMVTPR